MHPALALSIAGALAPLAQATTPPTIEAIAFTGQAAPDGSTYEWFGTAYMAADGAVAFTASFPGSLQQSLLVHRAGATSLAARLGQPAPGGGTFLELSSISVSRTGDVGFSARIGGVPGSTYGAWTHTAGGSSLLIREGQPLPGGGSLRSEVNQNLRAGTGTYAFAASTTAGTSQPTGIWAGAPGALASVARVGAPAPGWDGAGTFTRLGAPAYGASGHILFSGEARAQSASISHPGLWGGHAGNPQLVGRSQFPAPGGGVFYQFGDHPAINPSGVVAFTATLDGNPNTHALFAGPTTGLSRVARTGNAAPGTTSTFTSFNNPQINAKGDLAFFAATAQQPAGAGIWRRTSAGLAPVVRTGAPAPDLAPGVILASLGGLLFNDHAQCAFMATLSGAGVDATNSEALFFTDLEDPSVNRLLLRRGQTLEVAPGIVKTVAMFGHSVSGGEREGWAANLSNAGQIALNIRFTDDTNGVFIATVPAPSAALLLALGLAAPRRRTRST